MKVPAYETEAFIRMGATMALAVADSMVRTGNFQALRTLTHDDAMLDRTLRLIVHRVQQILLHKTRVTPDDVQHLVKRLIALARES